MHYTRQIGWQQSILFAVLLVAEVSIARLMTAAPVAAAEESQGIAVVEFFTSEGCSSCPPAEAALAELIRESKGKSVYALAFHVDYWDRLGWRDRFATRANTERQHRYATVMKLDRVYTPQAIVNGSRDVVGSDSDALKVAVGKALALPVTGELKASVTKVDGRFQLTIASKDLPPGTIINVALVEDDLTSDIRAGENQGRKLPHEHVVRTMESTAVDDHGNASAELLPPVDIRFDLSTIILFAQRPADLHVLAATEVKLPK